MTNQFPSIESPNYLNSHLDPESIAEMKKVMKIEAGLIPDDGTEITDVDQYIKEHTS